MSRNKIIFHILTLILAVLMPVSVHAQVEKALSEMKRGDSLHGQYRFEEAVEAYRAALDSFVDSLMTADDSLLSVDISDRMIMSENGRSMMDFAYSPTVVAKHRFSIDDFFLYYPLPDSTWREIPCQIDSSSHEIVRAMYMPEDTEVLYWSAADSDGIRNIRRTEYQDTIWTVPALLNENMTSAADEIYPMLSPDGKTMYLSSAGFYGCGGYDIYVSEWDEIAGDWSVPVNMGFPYSSPADDFLFVNSDDGNYTVFASNRDCPKDSVWVYVLEYDDMPVRRSVTDTEELVRLMSLDPKDKTEKAAEAVKSDIPENVDTKRYMTKMSEVRSLRDSLDAVSMRIEETRVLYDRTNDPGKRDMIANDILSLERRLPLLQDSLETASSVLQQIEMEFLFSGVVIDPDMLLAEADREMVGATADYVFTKMNFGKAPSMRIQEPEKKFDYSFKILEEGQFAEDNTIPAGIVYQIQMFSLTHKATIKNLKGLSPVFESRNANGRYIYRVGLFNTYNDVLANLNAVKKAGFRSAFIVAYEDGKEIKVSKARTLESKVVQKKEVEKIPEKFEVRIVPSDGELDMTIAGGIRQQAPGKEISRRDNENGTVVYVVGPFADKEKAENIAGFVRAMGISNASCVKIQ